MGVLIIEPRALFTGDVMGADLEFLGPDLYRDHRVRDQVVIPGGMGGCTAFGGDDHKPVAILRVDDRRGRFFAGFRALGGQQQ